MSFDDVTCVSWNIHRGRGADGAVNAGRVLDVLKDEVWRADSDVLCLQEADAEAAPHHGILDMGAVEAATGLVHVQKARAARSTAAAHGFLGVITLLHPRWTVEDVNLVDLPGLHPRGAVVVDAVCGTRRLRIGNTHLGLAQPLRIAQMRSLGQFLQRQDARPTVLCGDFNEWRPWGGLAFSKRVLMATFDGPARRSFPVGRPLLPLDRVLAQAPGRVVSFDVLDGPGIRRASDHRPVRAHVQV